LELTAAEDAHVDLPLDAESDPEPRAPEPRATE
jgi:hypothetical protein